ncbi:4Fe-4S cluster-binding domain-containing protein [Bacillus hwajinpoensis]|uniref:4Fe-4S cluster-binding domain-containing protein n=1 Tax=Guptibacillus hwajinpoensis TaxID=208199 RepID=A0A845F5D0_9BACL|nr:4Fe-4S single cluster domain-containing protein [Pseudalkalibacillus hwajinpoensis]MYL65999.1 4Fe-4S cluster-binding domain-containing protein [Pseudalkalibacillus hwajinpoensis]
MELQTHRFIPITHVEGPGKRACLWVQGCPIQCKGCGVPWTWPKDGGTSISVDELFEKIRISLKENNIEGVTFLGGEPFEQAEGLVELSKMVKSLGLSIMTFSGYTIEKIKGFNCSRCDELLSLTDLLIDGPFVESKLDLSMPWKGSSNQRYHFLTHRYAELEDKLEQIPNRIEVQFGENGEFAVNGMAQQTDLKNLLEGIGKRKL